MTQGALAAIVRGFDSLDVEEGSDEFCGVLLSRDSSFLTRSSSSSICASKNRIMALRLRRLTSDYAFRDELSPRHGGDVADCLRRRRPIAEFGHSAP